MRSGSAGFLRRNGWAGVALVAALIGLANMAARIGGDPPNSDFRLIWLAGRVWRAGLNPYALEFLGEGGRLFGTWSPLSTWVYPPHFWPVSLLFSLPDYAAGLPLWNVANIGCAIAASALVAMTLRETLGGRLAWAAAMIGLIGLMTASGSALQVGQTSFLILLGFALILHGIRREACWWGAIGMAIVMLKPNFGLVLCCAFPFLRGGVRMCLCGAAIVVGLCVPVLLLLGAQATIAGYLDNLGGYRSIIYNHPEWMTGLPNLVFAATGIELPAIGMSLVGAVLAAALMIAWRMRSAAEGAMDGARAYLVIVGGAAFASVGLHVYDLVLAAPLLVALAVGRPAVRILIAIGLLLIFRPENIDMATHIARFTTIAAFGCLAFFIAALIAALRPLPPEPAPPIS